MGKRTAADKGIVKGAPSGFVISLAVHAAAILLAGLLVVFNVTQKEEKKFVPPKPVDRPKMKLKKPMVKVKKSAQPKSTSRIVTKVQKASMPDIQLPEMNGMGGGFGDGVAGGFDIMPDLEEISVLGSSQSIGNDLEGTFYDFNRRRNGSTYGMNTDVFISELAAFVASGWKTSKLSRYYKSPKKLYTTTIAVPPMPSPLAPSAFGEPDNMDFCWMVHYRGKLVHKDGIKFRFVGNGDDIIVVAINGKTVMNGSRGWDRDTSRWVDCAPWLPSSADNRKWIKCHDYAAVSDLIVLEPGVPVNIDVMFAEVPGGQFNAFLCVMEEGVEYENNSKAEPILPLFKTAELPRALQDKIFRGMPKDEVSVTGGPIFNDYESSSPESTPNTEPVQDSEGPKPAEQGSSALRTWVSKDGKTLEAEFMTAMGDNVVLKTARGKQLKIPLSDLSEEDNKFVKLATPPRFKLDLGKKIRQKRLKYGADAIGINEYTFTAKVKQESSGKYPYPLTVEYYAIGSELAGNKFILLDKAESVFVPSELENGTAHEFSGRTFDMLDYNVYEMRRGDKYAGFLILVKDQRGEVIAHRSSPTWLYKNMDNLKKLPVGSFMDKTCTRVWPTPLRSGH
ncbi:SHD1 domain-containing protein [Pontiellaceae bacterium B12219]|nr:SHD1 domain-containing protein [Pontiellaceae bacterium B12219]